MLNTIKHCDKKLDFKPLKAWPAGLPAIAYQGELWSGFDLPLDHPVFNWTSGQALEIFKATYPQLSTVELAHLCQLTTPHWTSAQLAAAYGMQYTETTAQIFTALTLCPRDLQIWLAEKCVGPQELAIFLAVSPTQLTACFTKLLTETHSRNQGMQILELYGELLLMGKSEELLLQGQGEQWLQNLKQLRFPASHLADKKAQQNLTQWPWPASVQSKWIRKGDKAGVEIKFFASTPQEFKRTLHSLRKLEDNLQEESQW